MAVYSHLKGLMAEKDMSAKQLAGILNISPKSFSMRITGKKEWSYEEILLIVNILNASIEDVFPYMYQAG